MFGIKHTILVLLTVTTSSRVAKRYLPTWDSIDSRPLPSWYDDSKLGIFIHWGVFAVPSIVSEWFQFLWMVSHNKETVDFMAKNYRPDFTYADFAAEFTAEFFDAYQWAELFQSSGAKYIVFTSKHCEGFTNWPSNRSFNWNSKDVGPKRDIVGDLAAAIRNRTDLKFGLYHCLYEWVNPLYLSDKANNFTTRQFADTKTLPELYEIVNSYQPDIVWSDGDWEAPDTYWNSRQFIAWLYNDSPVKDVVVTNDRYGAIITCHHGGFMTCQDRYNPGVKQTRKFENAMTLDRKSWGFRRNAPLSDYLTMEELVSTMITTVSCGGNMLMNIGPSKEGVIMPIFQERLRALGQWLSVNGEGIYASQPWTFQNDTINPDVWYTMRRTSNTTNIYAFLLKWPKSGSLILGSPLPSNTTTVTLLGYPEHLAFSPVTKQGMIITISSIGFNRLPCRWAWTFQITDVRN